jgi:hypothetical protein
MSWCTRRPSPQNATREVARKGKPAPWGWENRSEAFEKGFIQVGWAVKRLLSVAKEPI